MEMQIPSTDPPDQMLRAQGLGTCIFRKLFRTVCPAAKVGNHGWRHLEKKIQDLAPATVLGFG